jgi:steroid 5-alpha reductase family enzyme
MGLILICWATMLLLVVVFVICEYIINKKFKDESLIKKWWRKNVISNDIED